MRKCIKKLTSGILAAAMVASLVSVAPSVKVEAEAVNYIENGDFSSDVWSNSGYESVWNVTVEDWNMVVDESVKIDRWADRTDTTNGSGFAATVKTDDAVITLSQTISNLPAGSYELSGYIKDSAGSTVLFKGGSEQAELGDSVTATGEFSEFKGSISLTAQTDYTIYIVITGKTGGWTCLDDISLTKVETDSTYTIAALSELINTIPADTSIYNNASVTTLKSAKKEAQALVDSNSSDSGTIKSAYEALQSAIKGLTKSIVNGDFEARNLTEWTIGETISDAGKVELNSDAADKTNYFLNVWSEAAGTYTISRSLTLQAGTYQLGVKNAGEVGTTESKISYQIGNNEEVSKTLAALQGWDTWNETKTDKIVLSEESEVKITISVTIAAGGYEKIDDVVLYTLDSMTLLKNLIASVTDTSDFTSETVTTFNTAKSAAQVVVNKGDNATENEIKEAYDNLKNAIDGLDDLNADRHAATNSEEVVSGEDVTLYVNKIENLRDDFITGVDVSSVISEYESGVKYRDFDGNELNKQDFFYFLAACGVNWVRVRVWNDPFDSNGNGYGGGNCNIDVAKEIGEYATKAGIKLLVDFHYSDFWTDPGKQMVPKAWENMTVDAKAEALESFTTSSLETLLDADIDVGMVQVGNETNNAICGESEWEGMAKMFSAGSRAVRAAASKYNKNILVAIHVANPNSLDYAGYAKNLNDYNVDYDVFASSYYPYFHGTVANLQAKLQAVADTYNKKVMVAETTYLSTWDDGDGHPNSRREATKSANTFNYDVSQQGQVDEFRAVAAAMADIKRNKGTANEKTMGIGVFSWEPCWIPVGNYKAAEDKDAVLESNQRLWEKYGSGWASSYSKEYDPDDAGKWYGGSAVDNEAIFDFDGNALESAKMYSYIRTGTSIDESKADEVLSVMPEAIEVTTSINVKPTVSTNATVFRRNGNNGTATVTWSSAEITDAIAEVGEYTITGTAVVEGVNCNVSFKLIVEAYNYLDNYGFETITSSKPAGWTIADASGVLNYSDTKDKNYRNGTHSLKFYGKNESSVFTATQTITLNKGVYKCGAWLEGGYNNSNTSNNTLKVYNKIGNGTKNYSDNGEMEGFLNFVNVAAPDLVITQDNTSVEFGIESTIVTGTWGCWDDAYINKDEAATVELYISELGTVTLDSKAEVEAVRAAYNALTDADKKKVGSDSVKILEAAEAKIADLQATADAAKVTKAIEALSDVTLDDKAVVEAARAAYDALTDAAKAKIDKDSVVVLEAAEAKIKELEDAQKAAEQIVTDEGTPTYNATPAAKGDLVASKDTSDKSKYTVTDSNKSNPTVAFTGTSDNKATKVTIPATVTDENGITYTVTKVADNALKGNKKVTNVTIGTNITEIGKNAFANCSKLKKVTINSSKITKIGASAFSGDKALTSVNLSKSKIKTIGKNAFANCKKLKTIKINGNKLSSVGKGAFKNVRKNAKITIYAKNKRTYNKIVKKIKKSGAKKVKYSYKKKK